MTAARAAANRPVADHENERTHTMANTTKVRTTFTPDTVLEVGDAELIDLKRQGLLHSHEPLTDDRYTALLGDSSLASPKRWKDGDSESVAPGQLAAPEVATDEKKKG